MKVRINLLAVLGAVLGVISVFMNWLTSDELQKIRTHSGSTSPFPEPVVPDLNLFGLCDTGWIFSDNMLFALAAFVFFAGTVLAFYSSFGAFVQVGGFYTFYYAFDSAHAAVISDLPSATGPKIALISIMLVMTGFFFPVFILSKHKLKGIFRRFLTVAPEKDVQQLVPLAFAAAGSALVLWGEVVRTSSVYKEGTLSSILFMAAGAVLLAIAMVAILLPWREAKPSIRPRPGPG